jgi:hypothetical protein
MIYKSEKINKTSLIGWIQASDYIKLVYDLQPCRIDNHLPDYSKPTIYIFLHLRHIFSGPSQSSVCLMCSFSWFKGSPAFYLRNFDACAHFGSHFNARGFFPCVWTLVWPPLHSSRSSFAWHFMQCSVNRLVR